MIGKKCVGFLRYDNRKYENFSDKFFRKLRKMFVKISVEIIDDGVIFLIPKYRKNKVKIMNKIEKQMKKEMEKNNVTELIVDKSLGQINEKRTKILLQTSVLKIMDYIFVKNGKNKNLENIYVLVNEYNKNNEYIIYKLVESFKTVNIITENLNQFRKLENFFYNKGILITISNNKRKGIRNAKYMINIDFDKNQIMEYNMSSQSIIINVSEHFLNLDKGFNGIIVNDFEIEINENYKEFINEFYGNINKKMYLENKLEIFKIGSEYIEEFYKIYNAEIVYLKGVRGQINDGEFRSFCNVNF